MTPTTKCKHLWGLLYQVPADTDFFKIYTAKELDAFKKCSRCGAIGKRSGGGSILQLPKTKWDYHKSQALRWEENLETNAIAQNGQLTKLYLDHGKEAAERYLKMLGHPDYFKATEKKNKGIKFAETPPKYGKNAK